MRVVLWVWVSTLYFTLKQYWRYHPVTATYESWLSGQIESKQNEDDVQIITARMLCWRMGGCLETLVMVEWCYPVVVGTSPKRKKTCRMCRRSKHHHGKRTHDVVGVGNQSVTLDGQSSLPVFTGVPRRKKIVWLGRSSMKNGLLTIETLSWSSWDRLSKVGGVCRGMNIQGMGLFRSLKVCL